MRQYKAVVLDMDGTLLDTLGDLTAGVNYALQQHGFPPRRAEEVRTFVGDGPERLMERACPPGTHPQRVAAVLATYLPYYAAHCRDTTAPYPGIPALLVTLRQRGLALAVVSNKQQVDVEALRQQFFADTLSVAVGSCPGQPLKPAPDSVFAALAQLGVPPREAWFVGDSEVDVITARNAGMPCVAVTWGFRNREALVAAGAEHLADTPQEAADYILGRK